MARRPKKKPSMRVRLLLIVFIFASPFLFILSAIISNTTGEFNQNLFWVLSIVFLVAFAALMIVFSLPVVKGKIGEAKVSSRLKRLAKKYGGKIINNVTIPGENGTTSQIDHIYISNYGVFVVETKNYAGRIYGNDNQKEWTQVLAYGNTKNKLYNPVKQNQTHLYRLKKLVNTTAPFFSMVVFTNGNIDYIDSDYVYTLWTMRYIVNKNSKRVVGDGEVERIAGLIMDYKLNPTKTNREHVQEIKQMIKDIDNNICPRCGGQLVLRTSKKDRRQFYACENYPRCTFIKK